jgi:hypothetical protein
VRSVTTKKKKKRKLQGYVSAAAVVCVRACTFYTSTYTKKKLQQRPGKKNDGL